MWGWRRWALESLVALGVLHVADALSVTFTPWHAHLRDLPLVVALWVSLLVATQLMRWLVGPVPRPAPVPDVEEC